MKKIYFFFLIFFASHKLTAMEHGSTVHYSVGELGVKWQFPSDHLPVGISIGDIHVALWNTLNTRYIYHIHTNHQGLKGSLITTANIPKDLHSQLTVREEMIVDIVLEMLHHPKVPRSLLVLQEVGTEVHKQLKRKLPKQMVIITAFPDDLANGDIYIYDNNRFNYISLKSDSFQIRPRNTYMTLTLQDRISGELYRFVQSHVPGGPVASAPARKEWAEEILLNFDPDAVTVVMGDMNRSADFFHRDLQEVAEDFGLGSHPFQNLWVPYPTHIDTYKRATWIDNFFIYTPDKVDPAVVEDQPDHFCHSLPNACSILRQLRPIPLDAAFELWCQLEAHRFAVFQGAWGCCTKKQLQLAMAGKNYEIFELYDQFCQSCPVDEMSTLEEIVQFEKEWMYQQREVLLEKWLGKEVIVIDQFDLNIGSSCSSHKMETILEVLRLAKQLRNLGKFVVLVAHQSSRTAPAIWKTLERDFSFYRSNIVQQGFLADYEEEALLSQTSLSREEKDFFKSWTEGAPTAYVFLMDLLGKENADVELDFDTLCQNMMVHLKHVWFEVLTWDDIEIQHLLLDIACDDLAIEEVVDSSDFSHLLETGFVGSKGGEWVMPQIVRDFLIQEVKEPLKEF